jgi:hypothetical protein
LREQRLIERYTNKVPPLLDFGLGLFLQFI